MLQPRGPHRAVRLALAAGLMAAGVCLVLGMTVLAVTVGSPGAVPAAPAAANRAAQPVSGDDSTPARPGSSAGEFHHSALPLAWHTIAAFRGATRPSRAVFRVAKPGTWGLSCPSGASGHMVVSDGAGALSYAIEFDAPGRGNEGTSWYVRDPGRHSIAIASTCPWSIKIVLAKPVPLSRR